MKEEKVQEIMKKVMNVWEQRHKTGKFNMAVVEATYQSLRLSPHDDGLMRVISMETKKTHLVPYEIVILNGLKGTELENFPEEGK